MDRTDITDIVEVEETTGLEALAPETRVSRRNFMVGTGVATGFALAAQPVAAATIRTDSKGLVAGDVTIPTPNGQIPGYMARPRASGPFPLILVVQEIFGVHEHIKDVCRRFAKLGHMAVAPELYFRQGDVSKLKFKQIFGVVGKVPDAQVMSDLDAAVKWAAGSGNGNVGKLAITGFCWGGRVVWLYSAHNPNVKAGVAWYGPTTDRGRPNPLQPKHPVDIAGQLKAPVLGLYGDKDPVAPMKDIKKMQAALKAAGNTSSAWQIYPGVGHAFYADYRKSYNAFAATDGWKRAQAWFKKHGAS